MSREKERAPEKERPSVLAVSVLNPEKHGDGLNAFVSFELHTRTNMSHFQGTKFQVRRRYNDFLFLRQSLVERYIDVIVPPIPEKDKLNYLDRFNPEFIERRRKALEKFLLRSCIHSRLCSCPLLAAFLSDPAWTPDSSRLQEAGMVKSIFAMVAKASEDVLAFRHKDLSDIDTLADVFENLRLYVWKFEEHLFKVQELSRRLVRREKDAASDLAEFGPAIAQLGLAEESLTQEFGRMGQCADVLSSVYEEQAIAEEAMFAEQLKEYSLLAQAARDVLKNREQAVMRYLQAIAHHQTLVADYDTAYAVYQQQPKQQSSSFSFLKGDSIESELIKLETKILESEKTIEEMEQALHAMSASVLEELRAFHEQKLDDFRVSLMAYANAQADFHQKVKATWATLLPKAEAAPSKTKKKSSGT